MSNSPKSLPTELLVLVASYLPKPFPTGATPAQSAEYFERQRALRDLCFTSRALYSIALPFLYQNIAITQGTQIVPLLYTLCNNPALRQFPRSFACAVLLTDAHVVDSTLETWESSDGNLSRTFMDVLIQVEKSYTNRAQSMVTRAPPGKALVTYLNQSFPPESLPQILVSIILLALMPLGLLEDVLIRVPGEVPLFPMITSETYSETYYLHPVSRYVDDMPLSSSPMLQILKTFRIEGEGPTPGSIWDMNTFYFPYWNLSGVRRLEAHGSGGDWLFLALSLALDRPVFDRDRQMKIDFLSRLEHLRISYGRTSPDAMYHILTETPNLQSLYWIIREAESDELARVRYIFSPYRRSFQDALMQAPSELESLHLESVPKLGNSAADFVDVQLDVEAQDMGTIRCLVSFSKLKYLAIDTVKLWGRLAYKGMWYVLPLAELLPPNLIYLELLDPLSTDSEWFLAKPLTEFAKTRDLKESKLRSIVVRTYHLPGQVSPPLHGSEATSNTNRAPKEAKSRLEEHVLGIKRLFEEAGVNFILT